MIMTAISTIDPGDVMLSISNMKKKKLISIQIVSLSSIMHLFSLLTDARYISVTFPSTPLSFSLSPVNVTTSNKPKLLHVGFPIKMNETDLYCPFCSSLLKKGNCNICQIKIMSSIDLIRSRYHLNALVPFICEEMSCYCLCFGCGCQLSSCNA